MADEKNLNSGELLAILKQLEGTKPGEYESRWNEALLGVMEQLKNREEFRYDMNSDALYQQYRDSYIRQGQLAMMDTMGQAAALTGGYGNSYAQNAGQQAYQGYLQELNSLGMEFYQLALDRYVAEQERLEGQYDMYAQQEQLDYDRYRDGVSDWNSSYDQAYGAYRDSVEDDQWLQALRYQMERDRIADSQWQQEFDEDRRRYDQEWALEQSGTSGGSASAARSGITDTQTAKKKKAGTVKNVPGKPVTKNMLM